MDVHETMAGAQQAVDKGDFAHAQRLLEELLTRRDHLGAWNVYAELLLRQGRPVLAKAVLRNIIHKLPKPHITDVIAARVPYTKIAVSEAHKLVYVPIPKCGSSTVKDLFLFLERGQLAGGFSHREMEKSTQVVPFTDLEDRFSSYFKFSIVRSPADRIRSYYKKNIVEARSLEVESQYDAGFVNIDTRPSYRNMLRSFGDYRALFRDFRHHTDMLVGFLGQNSSRFDMLVDLSDIDTVIKIMEQKTGETLPRVHNMKSGQVDWSPDAKDLELEATVINTFYGDDVAFLDSIKPAGKPA